jgi:hypothetical protein
MRAEAERQSFDKLRIEGLVQISGAMLSSKPNSRKLCAMEQLARRIVFER